MQNNNLIAVVGSTGAQGSGLNEAILNDPQGRFRLRALTRQPNSTKAQSLAAQGAEVVQADLDDEESLARAFDGAYGVFLVTNFWEHFSPEKELAQARNMAQAARRAGVQHAVWSTLEDTRRWVPLDDDRMPTLMGRYKVPHLDAKGEANALFTEAGVPTTFLLTSFYWDNFIHFGMGPQAGPDGRLAITMPMGDKKLPGIAAADIGRCTYRIFQRPELIGRTVGISGGHHTGDEMAMALSRVVGKDICYNDVPPEVFRSFGFPGAEDLGNMFQFKRDFNEEFCAARSVEFTRELNPETQDLHTWMNAYQDELRALVP